MLTPSPVAQASSTAPVVASTSQTNSLRSTSDPVVMEIGMQSNAAAAFAPRSDPAEPIVSGELTSEVASRPSGQATVVPPSVSSVSLKRGYSESVGPESADSVNSPPTKKANVTSHPTTSGSAHPLQLVQRGGIKAVVIPPKVNQSNEGGVVCGACNNTQREPMMVRVTFLALDVC